MRHHALLARLAPLGILLLTTALRAADVPIVDGQNAEDVLGQIDAGGGPDFLNGNRYDSQPLQGFDRSYDVAIDTVNHRLFVGGGLCGHLRRMNSF